MIRRDKLAALAVVLIVGACDRASETSPTAGVTESGTPAGSTSTTSVVASTSTLVEGVELPYARPTDPDWKVLFSIGAGPGGVTYEGGFEDWMLSGPQALTVAPDGSVWVADTNGRRLLRVAEDGSVLMAIETDPIDVAGLIDVAAVDDGVWGLEVLPALNRHRIVFFDLDGRLADVHELPTGLHLGDGLSGIAAAPDGQLWIELESGAKVYTAFDGAGEFSPQPTEGYELGGVTLQPGPAVEGMASFRIGAVSVETPVREQGGISFEGAVPGWVALLVSDVALDGSGAITVDLEVLYTDLEGDVAATATYPLDEVAADAYVPQDFIAVAPDGRLLAIKPRSDGLDIIELSLFPADAR